MAKQSELESGLVSNVALSIPIIFKHRRMLLFTCADGCNIDVHVKTNSSSLHEIFLKLTCCTESELS